jgi:hypothetical protein
MTDHQSEEDERRWPGGPPIPPGTMDLYDEWLEDWKRIFSEVMHSRPSLQDFTPISEPSYEQANLEWHSRREALSKTAELIASEVDESVRRFKRGELTAQQLADAVRTSIREARR